MAVTTDKRFTLDKLILAYEKKQQRLINRIMFDIMALFDDKVTEIAFLYAQRRLIGNRFLPKDIRDTIQSITNTVNARMRDIIINGIGKSFSQAEEKNKIVETAANGRRIPPGKKLRTIPGSAGGNKGVITAVDEFVKRKTNGLNLSKRVFKVSSTFKKAVNDTLIEGIKTGTPARELAKSLRNNLRNNKFTEHPGQGVYKSPQKNAERLARTEINLAYANADFERWQLVDSIIGIEVRLSNNHPKYDICDEMDGRYPKDFHFTKWHPNCRCIAIPILAPQEIRDAIMDYKLGLIDEPPVIPYITTMPASATTWMKNNATRVKGWKNTPYWVEANKDKVGKFFD